MVSRQPCVGATGRPSRRETRPSCGAQAGGTERHRSAGALPGVGVGRRPPVQNRMKRYAKVREVAAGLF